MNAFARSAAAVLMALLAAACSQVTADIARTSALSADSKGRTFAVVPLSGQRGTQEFETYSAEVIQRLRAQGLVPTGDPAKADYAVFLRYGVWDMIRPASRHKRRLLARALRWTGRHAFRLLSDRRRRNRGLVSAGVMQPA